MAEFKCLWTGFTLYWKANKTQLDNTTETVYHEERHDNGTVTSTLKIMEVVLSTYNETYIACVVANLSSNDESLPALLLVQGQSAKITRYLCPFAQASKKICLQECS